MSPTPPAAPLAKQTVSPASHPAVSPALTVAVSPAKTAPPVVFDRNKPKSMPRVHNPYHAVTHITDIEKVIASLRLQRGDVVRVEWIDEETSTKDVWFGTVFRTPNGLHVHYTECETNGVVVPLWPEQNGYKSALPAPDVKYLAVKKLHDLPRLHTPQPTPLLSAPQSQQTPAIPPPSYSQFCASQQVPHMAHFLDAGQDEDDDMADAIANDDADDQDDIAEALRAGDPTPLWPPEGLPPPFRCGDVYAPDVAALNGAHMTKIQVTAELTSPHVSQLSQMGLVKTTRQLHRRLIRKITEMPMEWRHLPLATAIIHQLETERRKRKWMSSTMLKYMASTQGALALLPMYTNSAETILLSRCPEWKQAMRAVTKEAKEEIAHVPLALTFQQMQNIVQKAIASENVALAAYLGVTWATCARPGCTLQLQKEDIRFNTQTQVSFTFRRGKGVLFRGPYTVNTELTPQIAQLLRERLAQIGIGTRIWTQATRELLLPALREQHTDLCCKSIRRGATQALAEAGVDETTIMEFTGHRKLTTLRRYLNWGKQGAEVRNRMTAAAHTLCHGL